MATTAPNPAIPFKFVEDGHRYTDEAGRPILSVTQVLDSVGIVDYSGAPEEAMKFKSEVGTAVHSACEFLDTPDKGDLDWDQVDARCIPYVVAYEKFQDEARFIPQHIEYRGAVRLPQGNVAFTLDRIGTIGGFP